MAKQLEFRCSQFLGGGKKRLKKGGWAHVFFFFFSFFLGGPCGQDYDKAREFNAKNIGFQTFLNKNI